MNQAQLRDIMKADNARRAQRHAIEDAILGLHNAVDPLSDAARIAENTVRGARVNPCLVRGIGTVNPPAPTSASRNSWDRGMRGTVRGIAPGTEDSSDGTPTVLVTHADGSQEIRTVSSFRGTREYTRRRRIRTVATTPETSRIQLRGMDWSQ